MLTTAQTSAGGAFVLLGAAIAWLLLAEFPVSDPGKATTSAGPLVLLEAAVPSIGDFTDFNVNTENPFVPFNLRKKEVVAIKEAKTPRPPKTPQVAQVDPPPKPKELPRLPAPGTTGPRATGVLISKDGTQALVTFPGQAKVALMKPGESANGWTLVEVVDGNVVRLKEDATGTVQNLVVPESIAVHKATPKPAKPADGKPTDKADGQKGQQQKPGGPGGQQGNGQQGNGQPPSGNPQGGKPHDQPHGNDRPVPQLAPPPIPEPPAKMM